MKERKFRKEVIEIIGERFEEFDQALVGLVMSFKQLYKDVIANETRISQLEKAVHEMQGETLLTQDCLAKTIIRNHRLKRQLKFTNARSEYFYTKAMTFMEQLDELRNELAAMKEAGKKTMPGTASEKAADAGEHTINEAAA